MNSIHKQSIKDTIDFYGKNYHNKWILSLGMYGTCSEKALFFTYEIIIEDSKTLSSPMMFFMLKCQSLYNSFHYCYAKCTCDLNTLLRVSSLQKVSSICPNYFKDRTLIQTWILYSLWEIVKIGVRVNGLLKWNGLFEKE